MKFIFFNNDLFVNEANQRMFSSYIKQFAKEDNILIDDDNVYLHPYMYDKHSYTIPDAIELDALARFYYLTIKDKLISQELLDLDYELFEITAKGHD